MTKLQRKESTFESLAVEHVYYYGGSGNSPELAVSAASVCGEN